MASQPLWQDIVRFSRHKYKFVFALVILGLVGLVIPIIPGMLLLLAAIFIIKPEWYYKFKKFFKTD
jgi:uncharacterized protein YqgC (DUF456 family)